MKILITGITGQDGGYLAELLLAEGHEVIGLTRRSSIKNTERLDHLKDKITLEKGDLTDMISLMNIFNKHKFDMVFNLGAMSHVGWSFSQPHYTFEVNTIGVLNLLECIRQYSPTTRLYQASSSEMFGATPPPQKEDTTFHPCSPYGCSKVASYHLCVNYREAYKLHISNGILFNHESPRRGLEFVTQVIIDQLMAQGYVNLASNEVPNIRRDWGHSRDYVRAMYDMMLLDKPVDLVISTGVSYSISEFTYMVCDKLGISKENVIRVDGSNYRPCEVVALQGDCSKAKELIGWNHRVDINELVDEMVAEGRRRNG